MGKSKCPYAGIEPGLSLTNREKIKWNREDNHWKKTTVERIVKKIMNDMKQISNVFRRLYVKPFGAGSSYEGLRADAQSDFDIDILLQIPEETKPELNEAHIPGYVQMRLRKLDAIISEPELHSTVSKFLEHNNYISINRFKSTVLQSIFDKARTEYFPKNIRLDGYKFKICKVQHGDLTPAFTLTIACQELDFSVEIDLVPCILLTKKYWPEFPFRKNPYKNTSDFFIVPTPPAGHPNLSTCFELSFQMQERQILRHRFWMKPTIRIMKLITRRFGHHVSSYAFKTLFMEELIDERNNRVLKFSSFLKGPFSYCLISMLEKYLECLENYSIQYFWYKGEERNLLDNLSKEQIESYRKDIRNMLLHIKAEPNTKTILLYL